MQPLEPQESYRQSLLAGFETCPRRTLHSLTTPGDYAFGWVGTSSDLGRAVHEVLAEAVRTMRAQGENQIPTQEMVEIMREVYAASEIVLPAEDRDTLRWLCLRFCEYTIDAKRTLGVEQRLQAEIVCPDGEIRMLTGQPDAFFADPPEGIVILDHKSGRAVPRSPRKPPEDGVVQGKQYLSERGHFQLDIYGLLVMANYPAANYVTLRELHLRSGEVREARLTREDLEHVEYEVGVHMQKLDEALRAGPDDERWKPRPGRHCLHACPVSSSCPIPMEQRGLGALETNDDADAEAGRYMVIDGLRGQMRDRLKAFHEENDYAPQVGDGNVLRWKRKDNGSRSFDVWEPETTDEREAAAT